MNPVVVADDVEKRYGETVALAGASLSIDPGEIFALIGPNGAGKTTLIRTLTGTATPDAGTVRVLDSAPERVDASRLGVLPQSFSPPDRLTARELLEYYATLYPDSKDPAAVLADVGLTASADTWYENLSGGQQRRVCVGSTLLNDPEVLVLDEPTTGIDPAGRRTIHRLVEELAAGGTTVLLTTHDMAEAERLADRVGLLADGSMLDVGPPATLVDRHAGSDRLIVEVAESGSGPDEVEAGPDDATLGPDGNCDSDDADPGPDSPVAVDSVDDAVTRVSEELPYRVERDRSRLVVYDVDPTEIGSIADRLAAVGLSYTGLRWTEPGLEAVYYALADVNEAIETGSDVEPGGTETDPTPNRVVGDVGGGNP